MPDSGVLDWPPFFTLQTAPSVQDRQLSLWKQILLESCRKKKQFVLHVTEGTLSEPPLANKKIGRQMSKDMLIELCNHMVETKCGKWKRDNEEMLVLWKSIAEWGEEMHQWSNREVEYKAVGIDFILQHNDTRDQCFRGMPQELMWDVLREMEKNGKCRISSNRISFMPLAQ